MNDDRRKLLTSIARRIEELHSEIEARMEEEQESLDSMPPNLQDGDRAEKSREALDHLESAMSSLDEAVDSLRCAVE